MPSQNDDERVVVQPPLRRMRGMTPLLALLAVLAAGTAGWLALRPLPNPPTLAPPAPAPAVAPVPLPVPAPAPPPAVPPRPVFQITPADEATILAARPAGMQVFRYIHAPSVLVLSFGSLHEQARMLDRLGAFVEKAGLPRDRVLDDTDLQAAIRLSGDTEDTYYYGHDYRAADLARFFALADHDGIALHPEEETLRALLTQEGMLVPGATGAVISIPPLMDSPPIDAAARATILHHELSHGAYFTDPAYAAYAQNFWHNVLTEAQRDGFRHFLGSEGYDTTNEDLMLNEAQAYLINTPDPRYFQPQYAGLTDAEAARLRQVFQNNNPVAWLKPPPTQ